MMEDSSADSAHDVFRPVLTMMKILGVFHDRTQRPVFSRNFHLMYCAIWNLVNWSHIGRYVHCLWALKSIDGNTLFNASIALFMITVVMTQTVFILCSPNRLPRAIKTVQNLHDKCEKLAYQKNGQKTNRRCLMLGASLMILILVGSLYGFVSSREAETGRLCVLSPFLADYSPKFFLFVAFYTISMVWQMLATIAIASCLGLFQLIIFREFKANASRLREQLELISRDVQSVSCHAIEDIRQQYELVVDIVHDYNRLGSLCTLMYYALVVPFLCLTLYAIFEEKYTLVIMMQASVDVVLVFTVMLVITVAGTLINSKLFLFLRRLTGTNVNLTAGGLFSLDITVLMKITGLLASYTILVFQIQASLNSSKQTSANITLGGD